MDWGYVAGYFDGEGSVYCTKRTNSGNCFGILWHNTHRESLEAIQSFIGCGRVRQKKVVSRHKPMFNLSVYSAEDVLRVCAAMREHLLIKRSAVDTLIEIATRTRPLSKGWGNLAQAGTEEIRRLYWEERLTQAAIGARFEVTPSAVKVFMQRNGIPVRPFSERDPRPRHTAEAAAKIAAAKREHWKDPVYRSKTLAALALARERSMQLRRA